MAKSAKKEQIGDYQLAKSLVDSMGIDEIKRISPLNLSTFRSYLAIVSMKKPAVFLTKPLETGKLWVARCE